MVGVEKIFEKGNGQGSAHWLQSWWQFCNPLELLLDQTMVVGPHIRDQTFDFLLHEGSICQAGLVGRSPYFDGVVVLIEFFAEEVVFLSKFMGRHLGKISLDSRIRVLLSSAFLTERGGEKQKKHRNKTDSHLIQYHQLDLLITQITQSMQYLADQPDSSEHFNKTYIKNDHFQRAINKPTIQSFARRIKTYHEQVKRPLKILDLCCGHGVPTFNLYQTLIKEKVEVDKVTGYDLSADQIDIAKESYSAEEKLHFQQKDIEQLNQNQGQFDVVTIFFGIHWIEELDNVVKMIGVCLKPKGLFLSITPLHLADLYGFRVNFMENSRWKECFDEKIRKPMVFRNAQAYEKAFEKHFSALHGETKIPEMNYSHIEFRTFIESWFPEVRYLIKDQWLAIIKEVIVKAYLSEFVDSIPLRQSGNVVKKSQSEFVLNQPIYFYEGEKKKQQH